MIKKYIVKLSQDEKEQLRKLLASATHSARKLNRARVLLKAVAGCAEGSIVKTSALSMRNVERLLR